MAQGLNLVHLTPSTRTCQVRVEGVRCTRLSPCYTLTGYRVASGMMTMVPWWWFKTTATYLLRKSAVHTMSYTIHIRLAIIVRVCALLDKCNSRLSASSVSPVVSTGSGRQTAFIGVGIIIFVLVAMIATVVLLIRRRRRRRRRERFVFDVFISLVFPRVNWRER